MRKLYVAELTNESKKLFESLAEKQNLKQRKINFYLDGEIDEIDKIADELGFRTCDNLACSEIFNEGYLTEDSYTFCSRECAEKIVSNIVEEDYFDYIFFTDWEPEL